MGLLELLPTLLVVNVGLGRRNGEPATGQSSAGRIASCPYAVSPTRPFAFLALPVSKTSLYLYAWFPLLIWRLIQSNGIISTLSPWWSVTNRSGLRTRMLGCGRI